MQYLYLALLALLSCSAMAQSHHHSAAAGQAGHTSKVTRTIKIDMTDNMRFSPDKLQVKAGDTIRFIVTNSGKLKHEMVLGSAAQLKTHYAAMLKNPEMEHTDANQLSLAAGKSGELIWQFSKSGTVDFACLQPGHYEAGMQGSLTIVSAASARKTHQH